MVILAATLVFAALVAEVLVFVSGANGDGALAQALGPAAGSPLLALAGGVAYVAGTGLLGRPRGSEEAYATREVILLLAAGAAAGFAGATVLGVAAGWRHGTLAVLALGGFVETLLAGGLCVRLATVPEKRRDLFLPGVGATTLMGLVHLVLLTLSAT